MEWCDQKDVDTPQAIVAVHHSGQNQVMLACGRQPLRTEHRQPKVQMFVIFPQHDLAYGYAVNLEDADAFDFIDRIRRREMASGFESKASNECVTDSHEAADPGCLLRHNESRKSFWACSRTGRELD